MSARYLWPLVVLFLGLGAYTSAAGEFIEWLDDGTVLLKLGSKYDNAVIKTRREDIGKLFGPGQQPFAGHSITLLTHDEGVKGPISGPLTAFGPVFQELTGGRVTLDRVPITDLYATAMLDLQRGVGRYDAIVVPAYFYGDLIAGNFIAPIDAMQGTDNYPHWTYDAMSPALRTLYTWNGVGYGVPNDADGQILYYRRDVLNNPDNQANFKAATGHDMPVPPTTWQQVLEIAAFFNEKNWDDHDPYPDSGMVMHLKPGEQGHYHFTSLAASFAIAPGPSVDQHHNVFWFDPTDMKPLINDPGHVAALEMMLKLNRTGPIEQIGWRLPQAWDYFLRGKAVFMYTWGDLGALVSGPGALAGEGRVRRDRSAACGQILERGR